MAGESWPQTHGPAIPEGQAFADPQALKLWGLRVEGPQSPTTLAVLGGESGGGILGFSARGGGRLSGFARAGLTRLGRELGSLSFQHLKLSLIKVCRLESYWSHRYYNSSRVYQPTDSVAETA